MMNAEIELYEALVDAGVSKDKARNVVLAQKDSMDQFLATIATKTDLAELKADLAEFRAYVDGRFNLVGEQMNSMMNRIVIRLGALMVVLTGLLGTVLTLMRH
jgi:hypothetical protein